MKVRFWGVRGSTPTPFLENLRYGGNTSCVEVRTPQGETLIFDCGTGLRSLGKQLLAEYGHKSINACIFLSHYHWDHIQGIPFFEPLYNPENYFFFHSFRGAARSVQEALEEQMSDPYFPVNMSTMEAHRHFYNIEEESLSIKDVVLRTKPLNHPQGCLGFRLECNGKVVVYATDNEPGAEEYDQNVRKLAEGADVLIYDGQYTPLEYANLKKGWGHSTWREGVNIAKQAGVKQLVLFHHDPDHSDNFIDSIVAETRKFFPNVMAAWEGMEIDLALDQQEKPLPQSDRRVESRQQVHVPLWVQGIDKNGKAFRERTLIENLSFRGAYFLLLNDPDPRHSLDVQLEIAPEAAPNPGNQKPASLALMRSQLVRNAPVELPNKIKRGVAVVFR